MAASLVGTGTGNVTTNSGASGTGVVVNKPANLANDQLIVALVYTRNSGATFTPPVGWTALGYVGNNCGFAAYGRYVHTASAETATTYTFTASTSSRWATEAFLVAGVNSNTFADVNAASAQESSGTTITAPAVTPTADGSLLVTCHQGHIASTTVPTMTAPSGMTSVGQFNVTAAPSSGSFNLASTLALGTGTGGVSTGTKVATLSVTKSNGSSFAFTLKAGSYVPPPPSLVSFAVGAPATDRFVATASTQNVTTNARLATSTSSLMTSPSYGATNTVDSDGYVRLTSSTSLTADTDYYCQIELDGVLQTGLLGHTRTLPTPGAVSYSFAAASCAKSYSNNSIVWDHLRTHVGPGGVRARFFMHLGDMHYDNLADNGLANLPSNLQSYYNVFSQAKQHQLYRELPLMYMASDHDAGGSNVDGTCANLPYFQAAYRKIFPSYPLVPDSNGDGQGTYHSFAVGRILYILTDGRSYMSPIANTDNSSKTKLGATQKAWLKTQLSNSSYPVKVWFHEDGWNNLSTFTGDDTWGAYNTERTEIGTYITANSVNMVYVHGDFHALAAETGNNNTWGKFPIACASPLDQTSFIGNGTWSNGFYPNPVSSTLFTQQYGWFDVTDTGSKITLTYTGYGIDTPGTGMEPKIAMMNVFGATVAPTIAINATAVGGKLLTRSVTPSVPLPVMTEVAQKVVTSSVSPTMSIVMTSVGHKSSVTAAKTSNVVITASAVGHKIATGSATSTMVITTVVSSGVPGTGSVTAAVSIVTSAMGHKRVAYSVTSTMVITTHVVNSTFDMTLTGYSQTSGLNQSASWGASILRMRLGQAVGDDVDALKSLNGFANRGVIPGQFVPNLTATTQSLGTASWAILAACGGLDIPNVPDGVTLIPGAPVDD
jgi:hypothetical protein